jgi:sugar PTS system EIIA component
VASEAVATITVLAPMSGRILPLEEVPDPVFAERLLGDGVAIAPTEGLAVAPVSGKLVVFHSAGHAFAIEEETSGIGVLVHVGLETVTLKGRGFERLAEAGDVVRSGQVLVRFDLEAIAASGLSTVSPVILPQLDPGFAVSVTTAASVIAGRDAILTVAARG